MRRATLAAFGASLLPFFPLSAWADDAAAIEAVTATLNAYYAAAKAADYDAWISNFSDEAFFYGTDATEEWRYAEFAPSIEESFESGQGWDFVLESRTIKLNADGDTAWFAEIAHFENTDYTLRPTGVVEQTEDGWKITQLVMGVPFPNDIYDPVRMGLQATNNGAEAEQAAAETILDQLHLRAAGGDADAYFDLYTEDAVFLGTDATERWTMDEFRAFAEPYFDDGSAWTYTVDKRHLTLSPMKNVAWFDEVLQNEALGETRGSGALIRTDEGWKITQYNLTLPVPNAMVGELADKIKKMDAE